jgi:hypothetical protein
VLQPRLGCYATYTGIDAATRAKSWRMFYLFRAQSLHSEHIHSLP